MIRSQRGRAIFWQVLLLVGLAGAVWYLGSNLSTNLAARDIPTGFGFLLNPASFDIGEASINYAPTDSYLRALLVGLINTVKVALIAMVGCTLIGTAIALLRMSPSWLGRQLAALYVDLLRNTPLLLQLFFWHTIITRLLPSPRQALELAPGFFLSNRGLVYPVLIDAGPLILAALLAVTALLIARRRRIAAIALACGAAALLLRMKIPGLDVPILGGFNFEGGGEVSPEFVALAGGLTLYTSAFVAEVVRAGILSVSNGQREAGHALGLNRLQVLFLIVLPQAMRVITPLLANQFLNLTKNSTLAVAIGYPDLVSIVNTTINQSGHAIEGVAIIMAAYLTISLAIAGATNFYNRRSMRREAAS
jgi:general L-amino acid transport system permease protein